MYLFFFVLWRDVFDGVETPSHEDGLVLIYEWMPSHGEGFRT